VGVTVKEQQLACSAVRRRYGSYSERAAAGVKCSKAAVWEKQCECRV